MRQFLAVTLPESLRMALVQLLEQLRLGPDWRVVRPDGIHLTLRFLGEVPAEADPAHRRTWDEVAAGTRPFRLATADLDAFPSRRRPRVLHVGIEEVGSAGRLSGLAARLEAAARQRGFQPERRTFRPHLTLARAARGKRPRFPSTVPKFRRIEFPVSEFTQYRSELLAGGARYTGLASFAFRRFDAQDLDGTSNGCVRMRSM